MTNNKLSITDFGLTDNQLKAYSKSTNPIVEDIYETRNQILSKLLDEQSNFNGIYVSELPTIYEGETYQKGKEEITKLELLWISYVTIFVTSDGLLEMHTNISNERITFTIHNLMYELLIIIAKHNNSVKCKVITGTPNNK